MTDKIQHNIRKNHLFLFHIPYFKSETKVSPYLVAFAAHRRLMGRQQPNL